MPLSKNIFQLYRYDQSRQLKYTEKATELSQDNEEKITQHYRRYPVR